MSKITEQIKKILNNILNLRHNITFRLFLVYISFFIITSFLILSIEKYYNDDFSTFFDALWFNIVTVTTVGYGDMSPVSFPGKITGLFIIISGIGLMSVITGKITTFFVGKQIKEGKGLVDISTLKNHFIICGWRLNMKQFLSDTLKINKGLTADKIVLINNQQSDIIENLKMEPELKNIIYVSGDFVEESTLKRANIKGAARALVLADTSGNISPEETDARTVMTVFTIESLNKKCYTCAEIINPKFRQHLENSNCDEIVLSSDFSQMLLTNASSASGISHVISTLFDPDNESRLVTTTFPNEFINKTFKDLRDYFYRLDGSILLGLLENSGNIFEYKREAIKEAQKTPDISQLIKNLKEVKGIKPNEPRINPGNHYVLKKHSKAIIVEPTV